MTAFWIALIKQGIFPEWMSFQAMGFPFLLSMQSGVFYAPFWFFGLFDHAPYTLQAAVIFQVLHVLLGAIGCWMYARLMGMSISAALFVAVAFQFFGGFYSNSMHADIIRAFAYLPWLFWCVYITREQTALSGRNLFAPLIIALFITGSYPGNVAAQLFALIVGAVLFWVSDLVERPGKALQITLLHCQVAGLCLLGLLLASVYLWPTFELKSYLVRSAVWTGPRMSWLSSYWNSLFQPSNFSGIYIYSSMTSAFVTAPVFCMLFLVTWSFIKRNWFWVVITFFSGVMAGGPSTPVYMFLLDVFPVLGHSRFPSSDYRGLLGFGLILLSGKLLDAYFEDKLTGKLLQRSMLCIGLLFFYWAANIFAAWLATPEAADTVASLREIEWLALILIVMMQFATRSIIFVENHEWLVAIFLSISVFASLYFLRQQRTGLLCCLVILEIISGVYFLTRISDQWRTVEFTEIDVFYGEVDLAGTLPLIAAVHHSVATRPACLDLPLYERSWEGYLKGTYTCNSKDPKSTSRDIVDNNPVLSNYMHQAWKPYPITKDELVDCQPGHLVEGNMPSSMVNQISYGLQHVSYQVHAAADFCFVENEMWFPGWSGTTSNGVLIDSQAYCGALRSWCLPKGDYQWTAEYETPKLREAALVSLMALVFYGLLCVWWFVQRRATPCVQ